LEHLQSTLTIAFAQRSLAGTKPDNQDTVGARIPEGHTLASKGIAMAVADGVSSSASAKQASQSAVTGFLTDYYATPDTWRTQTSAIQVIQSLNRHLWSQSQNSVRQEGSLTTFSAVVLKGDTAFTFHVGDSRISRFRGGSLEPLTRDHSQRIDRKTTYLSRALGADPALEVDMDSFELALGDIFLLTTDGVHDFVSHTTMAAIIHQHQNNLEQLADALISSALNHGSQDNLSVQICRIDAKGCGSQEQAVAVLTRLPFPPLLEPGNALDGMRVKKILHESERSQVYWVESAQGAQWVMKTPSVNYEDDPAYIERFVMESWIGARIQSPHVVRVVEPPQARSCLYYLTEYIAGPTLAQMLKERAPFAIPDAVELMEQIVRGARVFHRRETLHQDLKPGNIMVGSKGAVIIDFGSCHVAGVQELRAPFPRDTILGTLDYSAPEYRFGTTKSPASDQFSLGVIFYEMLTGKRPFGDAYGKVISTQALGRLRYISACKYNPLIPYWLDKAMEKSVSLSPGNRYSSLSEWLTDLRRPNPQWLSPREQPLLERKPLLFWQIVAAAGWALALVLGYWLSKG
jgi:serine/threonine protein phosphatase PrpC